MAKLSSLDEEERLLLSLEDVIQEEASILEKVGLGSKDKASKASQTSTNSLNLTEEISKEFDKLLLESIDEALASLGEAVKNSIYSHLQNDFNIKRDEIPDKICEFSDILHKIFGMGAGRLEVKCMKNICDKVKVSIAWPEYDWPMSKWIVADLTFHEYVENAKKNYLTDREKNHSNI
jgi:hypothetical protein